MSSSFDELTPEQVEVLAQTDLVPEVSVYDTCSRLAAHYIKQNLRIRRGVVVHNGEVKAEPLDFLADLHLKAKRCLDIRGFCMWEVFSREYETAMLLPRKYQDLLSKEWLCILHEYADLFKQAQRAWQEDQREERRKAEAAKRSTERSAQKQAEMEATLILFNTDQDISAANPQQ